MQKIVIGVDPHKLSATIEVVDDKETVLATGRFGSDKAGYAAMRKHVAGYPDRPNGPLVLVQYSSPSYAYPAGGMTTTFDNDYAC